MVPPSPAPDSFAELDLLRALLEVGRPHFETEVVCETECKGNRFPVHLVSIGSQDPAAPAIGLFAGIHGLERIGTQLLLDYMRSLLKRLQWDALLHLQLQSVRLMFMPIVNPGGMWAGRRANPNGVDLMRNAPQDAEGPVPFLAGGQRVGPWLPWYRGPEGGSMERESLALLKVVQERLQTRPLSFAVDCHSGYGWRDSIWFPYARTCTAMANLPEMYVIKTLFEQAHPHHGYAFEPQSHQYLAHGDLWDYAYDRTPAGNVFLPMTLELGSWLWIKKNPRQLFSRHGIFNPIKAHRTARVLRRHVSLFDFLARAAYAPQGWLPAGPAREAILREASEHWQAPTRRQRR